MSIELHCSCGAIVAWRAPGDLSDRPYVRAWLQDHKDCDPRDLKEAWAAAATEEWGAFFRGQLRRAEAEEAATVALLSERLAKVTEERDQLLASRSLDLAVERCKEV